MTVADERELVRLQEMELALDALADLLAEEAGSHRLSEGPSCQGAADAYDDCVARINAILYPNIPGKDKP